jgi:hypothetical protein
MRSFGGFFVEALDAFFTPRGSQPPAGCQRTRCVTASTMTTIRPATGSPARAAGPMKEWSGQFRNDRLGTAASDERTGPTAMSSLFRFARYRPAPHPLAPDTRTISTTTIAPIAALRASPTSPPPKWKWKRGRSHSPSKAPTIPTAPSPIAPRPEPRMSLLARRPAIAPTSKMTTTLSSEKCTRSPPGSRRRLNKRRQHRARIRPEHIASSPGSSVRIDPPNVIRIGEARLSQRARCRGAKREDSMRLDRGRSLVRLGLPIRQSENDWCCLAAPSQNPYAACRNMRFVGTESFDVTHQVFVAGRTRQAVMRTSGASPRRPAPAPGGSRRRCGPPPLWQRRRDARGPSEGRARRGRRPRSRFSPPTR